MADVHKQKLKLYARLTSRDEKITHFILANIRLELTYKKYKETH